MSAVWTYEFECDKPITKMLAALNKAGPWTWAEQYDDTLGAHLCTVSLEGVRIRIFGLDEEGRNGPAYAADLKRDDGCKADRASIDRVFRRSLGKLAARNLIEYEY